MTAASSTPLKSHDSIVIIGAGQGGFQAAVSLRDAKFAGRITLIGDEPYLPYQRPPLSKAYLGGALDEDGLTLRPASYFERHDIDLLMGDAAVEIDRDRQEVKLASGRRVNYAHLILATGTRPRPLVAEGAELAGVHVLRTKEDADALRPRLIEESRVAVVGGGFIGMEFAAVAADAGHEVVVIEGLARIMARSVSPDLSEYVTAVHRGWGTRILLGSGVQRLIGDAGRVTGVVLANGETVVADIVLVVIGVLPNVELAQEAGLEVANGISVDESLLTSDPRISAIGDCASYPSAHDGGRPTRLESVQNAVDHARHVAARLTDGSYSAYRNTPWFWTHQFDLNVQIAGIGSANDECVVRTDPAGNKFSVYRFQADRLVCVESVNQPGAHILARKMLTGEVRPTPAQVADLAFDMKALLTPAV
ncbi:NAD(P)/FAD-dependent oxidoreductase [Pseudarthrobacter oxydans]|uniref:NAD(P)/FAD-dependent oxidoreductase n=1 Tax=Pseudarthrobacter oxydans TaxID=1671 RepID=UPI0038128ECD